MVGLGTCGCGGSSSSGNGGYKGSYVGTVTYTDGSVGNYAFYVDSAGNVTGRGLEASAFQPETVTGTLQSSGNAQIGIHLSFATSNYGGIVTITSQHTLTGHLVNTADSTKFLSISAPSIANSSKFAGSYTGQFSTTASNVTYTGTDAAVIDKNNNVRHFQK